MVLLATLAFCALLQQRLSIRMYAAQLLRDRMLRPELLLHRPRLAVLHIYLLENGIQVQDS